MEAALAFLPLLPTSGPSFRGKRVRINVERIGRLGDRRRVNIALSRDLAEALNWQAGDRIVISLGIGADRGRAQLSRVAKPTGGHKLSKYRQSHTLAVRVSTPVLLQGEDVSAVLDAFIEPAAADFTVADGTLHVVLAPLTPAATQPVLRTVA